MALHVSSNKLSASISAQGGVMQGLWWRHKDGSQTALLRSATDDQAGPGDSAGFPLVPFGNRLGGNSFTFEGRIYHLAANSARDPLYLHGDGWLALWNVVERSENKLTLSYRHDSDGTNPYDYTARQVFRIDEYGFSLQLSVVNEGAHALPFGLGWHPYFPLRPDTLLEFQAKSFHEEAEGSLPGNELELSDPLDFRKPRSLPVRWINNGFSGLEGPARILWPETGLALEMSYDPIFAHAFLYLPYAANSAAAMPDFFCLEPMTHKANGHHRTDLGGLHILAPGETLAGTIHLTVNTLPKSSRSERSR
ncbi:aldose 1-epimerase [Brucella oryzae]|uniref:aldose 1-epimerase n=1 Tax=Brucella oryzae TaxID=335286 RepID=UPI001B845905|nr:aldose 1-epimerase [Brucella oryzae]MBR7654351.1 aldose 1-epimerase [Brucella oryzae]